MAPAKQQVLELLQVLPDEATLEDIMAELYFRMQVEAGLKELDEGKGVPQSELEKRMSRWLQR